MALSYSYRECLNSPDGSIRVLRIHPGAADTQIECSLIPCNIYEDTIEHALSYVWGKGKRTETILVDGKDLLITSHLHEILDHMRQTDDIRNIWVDAICINQQDAEEKTHQVRLMRDIYSRAENTFIWLGGHSTEKLFSEQTTETIFDPADVHRPLPHGIGGISIDQFNLSQLLEAFHVYRADIQWNERQVLLYLMISRCVIAIVSHEWWERIWTLQEGALPPQSPTIFFHGQRISIDDVTSALKLFEDTGYKVNPEKHAIVLVTVMRTRPIVSYVCNNSVFLFRYKFSIHIQ
ncbi:heterokaryon incompatibility protein-domain-containing protein [Xylogone sp. PMI_703]|nr:heterokaryon incompatibility protein-domain-containing protein [Xylogone sp. PMI_703]